MRVSVLSVALVFLQIPWGAGATPNVACTVEDIPETSPRPVDLPSLTRAIERLESIGGRPAGITVTDPLKNEIEDLFRRDRPRTKLDQFYRMLYLLARAYPYSNSREAILSGPSVAAILKAAAVIENDDFLGRLERFHLVYPKDRDPFYHVHYAGDETRFALNQGKGFSLYRNGMCQLTTHLVFKRDFSFRMRLKPKSHNLLVYDYSGVDLYGEFGTRLPLIKIDLNYVTLDSVEFIEGTNLGTVKAKVSRHEFEVNDHTWLLKAITRLVTDTSTQPIDW